MKLLLDSSQNVYRNTWQLNFPGGQNGGTLSEEGTVLCFGSVQRAAARFHSKTTRKRAHPSHFSFSSMACSQFLELILRFHCLILRPASKYLWTRLYILSEVYLVLIFRLCPLEEGQREGAFPQFIRGEEILNNEVGKWNALKCVALVNTKLCTTVFYAGFILLF